MFIDFLKYDDAQHYFVYTDKQIYKFRYLFRFKLYEEIINNLVKIQINYMHLKIGLTPCKKIIEIISI